MLCSRGCFFMAEPQSAARYFPFPLIFGLSAVLSFFCQIPRTEEYRNETARLSPLLVSPHSAPRRAPFEVRPLYPARASDLVCKSPPPVLYTIPPGKSPFGFPSPDACSDWGSTSRLNRNIFSERWVSLTENRQNDTFLFSQYDWFFCT